MKTNKFNMVLLAGMSLFFCGCQDWLDVRPKSEIKDTELLSNESGFKKQLAGVYTAMTDKKLYGKEMTYGLVDVLGQVWQNAEGERYNYSKLYDYEEAQTKTRVDSIWQGMYNAIANVNIILDQIDGKQDVFTGKNYSIIKGEALALRAYMHFDLLRLFGASFRVNASKKAIPYVSSYTSKIYPQLTVKEVAGLVVQDLLAARTYLQDDPILTGKEITTGDDNGYLMNRQVQFNYYAATGLLARVYLYMENPAEARKYAKEVIESEKFKWVEQKNLTGALYSRDLTFASEHLFALNIVKLGELANTYFKVVAGGYYFSIAGREAEYFPSSSDYRGTYLFTLEGGVNLYAKYWQFTSTTSQPVNSYYQNKLPLIRLSEMYLIMAESYAEENPTMAASYLDKLTTARNLGNVSETPGFEINNAIFQEYRREFLAEGQLFFYYKRLDQANIPNAVKMPKDCKGYILPLPDVEKEFGNREENR